VTLYAQNENIRWNLAMILGILKISRIHTGRKKMSFVSEAANFVFYNNYAKDHGFIVRNERVKRGKVFQEKYV
jgi:hypothetical protein